MRKKIMSWFMVIAMAVTVFPAATFATETPEVDTLVMPDEAIIAEDAANDSRQAKETVSNLSVSAVAETVVASGILGDNVDWTLNDEGLLTISGTGPMYDFGTSDSGHPEIPFEDYAEDIKQIQINEGVTTIGRYALAYMNKVTGTLTLPEGMTKIGKYGMTYSSYSSIILPNSLEELDNMAFGYNKNLTTVNLPTNLKSIDRSAFDGCTGLKTIQANNNAKYFMVKDGVLFSKDLTDLVYYPPAIERNTYNVPVGTKRVIKMSVNDRLTEVMLPDGLEEIGAGAFTADRNLQRVNIPSTVTTVGDSAFYNCHKLKTLDFPKSVTRIGKSSLLYCKVLEKVYIRNPRCVIANTEMPKTTLVYGYINSTTQEYCKEKGLQFIDIETGEKISESADNQTYVNFLPTKDVQVSTPLQMGVATMQDAEGRISGYQTYEDTSFVKCPDNIKTEIKTKTLSLTTNCATDLAKAKAICDFIEKHMTYETTDRTLEYAWKNGSGDCNAYARLTATMLYYADIPNALAFTASHVFNLALCEGKWIDVDSQGIFNAGVNEKIHGDIKTVMLRDGDLTYVVDDTKGLKIAGIGQNFNRQESRLMQSGIDIPASVVHCYKYSFSGYKGIEIRGVKESAAEKLAEEMNYSCISYSGKAFKANFNHNVSEVSAVKSTCKKNGHKEYWQCSACGKAFWDKECEKHIEDVATETAVPKAHTMIAHKGIAATCTKAGQCTFYECSTCGNYYEDSRGEEEIIDHVNGIVIPAKGHKLTFHKAKKATCTCDGNYEYWGCERCGELFSDSKGAQIIEKSSIIIVRSGHDYRHISEAAGIMHNGKEYDKCDNCGAEKDIKIIKGYATSYVKSFKVSKGKKCFTAKWKKQTKANQKQFAGYQIRYSMKKDMSGAKYITAGKTSKSRKVKGLTKKKTYYVQARTYTTKSGTTFYSKWSSVKTVKVK